MTTKTCQVCFDILDNEESKIGICKGCSLKQKIKQPEKKLSEEEYYQILKAELESPNLHSFVEAELKNKYGCFAEVYDDWIIKILSVITYVQKNPSNYKEAWLRWAREQNEKIKIESKDIKTEEISKEEDTSKKEDTLKQYLELIKDKEHSGASEILVQLILNHFNIYTTKDDVKTEVWIYKEGIYIPQGKSEIKIFLRDFLGKFYSQFVFGLVMNKLEPDTFIDTDVFFNQKHIEEIPVINGLLNIKTRELKPFTPEKIFFNKLPVVYDDKAECPLIDKFLSDVLSKEDDRIVFYELGGSILLKEYKYEKAFMLTGNGRNGKDKTLELLKRMFGIENCCAVPLSSLVPDSFIISEFFGKMINVAGEVGNNDLKDTSMFKALTGRSIIQGQRKFLRAVTFQNYAKFVFACNELPMVYDNSKGFWARWVLLEFPYTFVSQEEIDNTKDKINLKLKDIAIIEKITTPSEMSGLLNKFLEGFERLEKQKDFSCTRGSDEIKSLWIRKSNSVMAFCVDSVEDSYDNFISKKELRKKYTAYCKQHKINPKSDFVIKKTLQEMFGVSEDRKEILSNCWEAVWSGIKFKDIDVNFSKEDISNSALEFQEALKQVM